MVHELLLQDSQTTAQQEAASTAEQVSDTIKRAFWDSLRARLQAAQAAGDREQMASDVVGLVAEVQEELLALAPTRSNEGAAINHAVRSAFDKVCQFGIYVWHMRSNIFEPS